MLYGVNQKPQAPMGTQPHWALLRKVIAQPAIYPLLQAAIADYVANEVRSSAATPRIESRRAGAVVLTALDATWHDAFAQSFPPSDAAGVFGMALWHLLAQEPEHWCFAEMPDAPNGGPGGIVYWRI